MQVNILRLHHDCTFIRNTLSAYTDTWTVTASDNGLRVWAYVCVSQHVSLSCVGAYISVLFVVCVCVCECACLCDCFVVLCAL